MKYSKRDLAQKAIDGDEDAMGMLILVSPSEEMGDMDADSYAKHVSSCPDETPEEDVGAVVNLLIDAGLDEDHAITVSSGIFSALGYY